MKFDVRELKWRMVAASKWAAGLFGVPWNSFYRRLLNYLERRTSLDQILSRPEPTGGFKGLYDWQQGRLHVDLMREQGLTPDMTVLDFGCGYGRTAIPLIAYLKSDRYIGTDLSDRRIELAQEWSRREGLEENRPRFVASSDNDMPFLTDGSVDVVWTFSVFNHMPDLDLRHCLTTLNRVLRPDGRIFFYYVTHKVEELTGTYRHTGAELVVRFPRSDAEIAKLCAAFNFDLNPIPGWEHTLREQLHPEGRLVLLTRSPGGRSKRLPEHADSSPATR